MENVLIDVKSESELEFQKNRSKTQILINGANIIDNADGQLLPAVYDTLRQELGFDITQLGFITAIRSLLQALSTPIWGWFSDKYSRKNILFIGCVIWGIFTLLMALSSSFEGILFFRALTGLGLAVIVPTAQSLITDYFYEKERGVAFGWLGLTGVIGAVVGTLFATAFSSDMIFGIDGWRFVFIVTALFSILLGICVWFFGKDPRRGSAETELHTLVSDKTEKKFKITRSDYKKLLNKTFLLIVLQGVVGLLPWNSILFVILWFEYIGYDPIIAGLMFAVVAIGSALGNLFGGWLGDKAAQWNHDKGRIFVAQISVFSGIPLMFVIFWLLPRSTDLTSMFLFLFFGTFTGFMISWAASCANYPIFSELFEPEIRSTVYSFDRLFEGSVAASGTFIVAVLAESLFGYINPPENIPISSLPLHTIITNINAMANALVVATVIPWILCLFFYTFVYFTYPSDRDRLKKVLQQRKQVLISQ